MRANPCNGTNLSKSFLPMEDSILQNIYHNLLHTTASCWYPLLYSAFLSSEHCEVSSSYVCLETMLSFSCSLAWQLWNYNSVEMIWSLHSVNTFLLIINRISVPSFLLISCNLITCFGEGNQESPFLCKICHFMVISSHSILHSLLGPCDLKLILMKSLSTESLNDAIQVFFLPSNKTHACSMNKILIINLSKCNCGLFSHISKS